MNTPMMEAARHAPQMMSGMGQGMSQMMAHPVASGAMLAAGGYAAGKGLLGGLLKNPLAFIATGVAAGVAAGYLLHKYENEIIATLTRVTGMGKDFVLHQKENLDDLIAEGQENATAAAPSAPAQE